jgi:hypothetical protein
MKEQILTLERTDDLHSLRDKILRTQAERLILIWAALEEPLTRRLDMVLLTRWAALAGSELTVVSADERVCRLARAAGVDCHPSLTAAALAGLSTTGRKNKNRTRPFRFQRPFRDRPPSLRGRELPTPLRIGIFSAAVLSLAVGFLLLLPSARIRAVFPSRAVVSAAILDNSVCSDLETSLTLSDRRPTTGRILAPTTFAAGSVTLTNLSTRILDLPGGLRIASAAGVVFETVDGLVLAPNQPQSVGIRALQAGPQGNLPGGTINRVLGPLALSLKAENPQATAGGDSEWRNAVAAADGSALETGLNDRIRRTALEQLQALAGDGRMMVAGSLRVETDPQDRPDLPVNAPADSVGLTLHARAAVRTCPADWIRNRAVDLLAARLLSGETLSLAGLDLALAETESGEVQLTASGLALQIPDANEMALSLRAQTPEQAAAVLREKFHALAVRAVERTPGWLPLLPLFPYQIEILAEAG